MNIQVTNTVDNCPPPQNFTWSDDYILHGKVPCIDLDFTTGCECETDCADSCNDCICIAAQEGEHAYDQNECVRFAPTTMAIYECNLKCACNILCQNRVTQRGPRLTFEIYRTPNGKGWGVRTLNALKKGQFVSKYIGEIITTAEAVNRNSRMSYMFDLDFFGYESSKYVIDAYDHGNISRLYNHSCEPNMATYSVFVDTHDPSRHELAFFTTRAIEPNEELTFDYRGFRSKSQKKDVGAGKDRPGFQCYCGTKSCQGIIPLFHTDK
ncbi:hypothetical protein BC833DRAFT_635728 [Globomyces pollinis-pini]|nr:hypothetical protein BC833DRAFT_635728 [Globomyces pollinis-pini]